MSCSTCSNSKPRVSTAPAASAQNMNASSGSGLWPSRISTRARLAPRLALPTAGQTRVDLSNVDPGLPEGDLQARRRRRARLDDRARRAASSVSAAVGQRDGQEARRARARRARAVPRRHAHARRRAGRARGDPPPPPARALPRRDARDRRRRRARRGRPARARALRGARGADRQRARLPDPRSARRPDPGRATSSGRTTSRPTAVSGTEEESLQHRQDLLAA